MRLARLSQRSRAHQRPSESFSYDAWTSHYGAEGAALTNLIMRSRPHGLVAVLCSRRAASNTQCQSVGRINNVDTICWIEALDCSTSSRSSQKILMRLVLQKRAWLSNWHNWMHGSRASGFQPRATALEAKSPRAPLQRIR